MEQHVTIQRAAELLSVSEDTIRRMLPKLGAVDITEGRGRKRMIRIPVRSLEAYLHDCLILPPIPATRQARPNTGFRIERRRA